jgi:hypothetical protein
MTDENKIPDFDTATAEFFTKLFQDTLTGMTSQVIDRVNRIEESVEALEKQIATLVIGYGEQAVFMEALVAQLAFSTDEARQKFQEDVSRARKSMLEVMNDASKGFMAESSEGLATAITDLVESELFSTDAE